MSDLNKSGTMQGKTRGRLLNPAVEMKRRIFALPQYPSEPGTELGTGPGEEEPSQNTNHLVSFLFLFWLMLRFVHVAYVAVPSPVVGEGPILYSYSIEASSDSQATKHPGERSRQLNLMLSGLDRMLVLVIDFPNLHGPCAPAFMELFASQPGSEF